MERWGDEGAGEMEGWRDGGVEGWKDGTNLEALIVFFCFLLAVQKLELILVEAN